MCIIKCNIDQNNFNISSLKYFIFIIHVSVFYSKLHVFPLRLSDKSKVCCLILAGLHEYQNKLSSFQVEIHSIVITHGKP